MDELKKHQPSMSIDKQISNLKEKGLVVNDEDYTKKVLNDISYFRLIKAYSLGLKEKNGNYNPGTSFEQIVELYEFNLRFRQITFCMIERVEVSLRCRIGNYISEEYGVMGYLDKENFDKDDYHKAFLDDIKEEIRRNSRAPFVKNFRENYEDGELPVYALVEILSLGTLSKLFKNMKNRDKKIVSRSYGVGYTYMESWIESIAYVRNVCAHYGRLYNAKLVKTPILYKEYTEQGIRNNRVYAVLLCMRSILKDDEGWNKYVAEIKELAEHYKGVNLTSMGFPKNWETLLKV